MEIYIITIVNIRSNTLSNLMLLTVLLVSSCVILNSIDYLSIIDSYLFLLYILIFQFTMIIFIFTHDLILSFLYWDILGIISYLLINYWSSRINCGMKALIYNKIGDCSFILILSLSYSYLTFINYYPFLPFLIVFNLFYSYILSYSHSYIIIQLILIIICFSKSAQLPFSSWLLNAMSAPTPISALLHSSTMVIAGVIIGLIVNDIIIEVLDSFSLFFLSLILLILLTLLWSLLKAIYISDIKSIIAYSTISQISYMFIALLINPFLTLYHIVIHALFKSLLFLLSGSLIHTQYNYQSINKVKINQTFIKTTLLFTGSVLILSLSKETIIYSSNSIFSLLYITMLLILGTIYTIIYTFNIYVKCFYYCKSVNLFTQSHIYYSFLIPFLIISSILLDIILEYIISLHIGTLFYTIDNGTLITYLIINEHFTIICVIIPIIIISIFIDYLYNYYCQHYLLLLPSRNAALFNYYSFSSNSTLSIPIYQDLFIFMSTYFIKGPINLLEVMSCLNYCYNLYHIHYFNILFIIYYFLFFILLLTVL